MDVFRVCFPVFGVWRSLVARFVRDEEAAGSSPATPTGERKQRGDARGCGCCHAGVCGGIGGALGVCGWRLGVCARVLSVLVSKLGPVWVGRLRVSAHAGWAGRWCGWCACVPLVGRTVVAWLSLVFVSAPLLFCLTRNRYPLGVWVHVPPEVLVVFSGLAC